MTGQKGAYRSPFAFMVPQVLFFQFLLITTVVGVWKDLGNGYGSLALAWNATNTLILGGFVVTAWKEGHRARAAIKAQKRAARHHPRDRPRHRTSRRCRMTWTSRIRLLAGMLVVLVVAALATYQLNETRGVAASDSAQILAKTYDVGTPYSGLVVDQLVDVGDPVTTGPAALRHRLRDPAVRRRRTASPRTVDRGDADRRRRPARRPRHGRRRRDRDRLRARHVRPVGHRSWRPCSARTPCTCRPSTRSPRTSTHGWRTTPRPRSCCRTSARSPRHVSRGEGRDGRGQRPGGPHPDRAPRSRTVRRTGSCRPARP